jgi:hypothetical protein
MVLRKGQMSGSAFRAGRTSAARPEEVVDGKTVFLARHDQEEQKESQAGNDGARGTGTAAPSRGGRT